MRQAGILLFVALAACSKAEDGKGGGAAARQPAAAATDQADEDDGLVRCALEGAKTFDRTCTREIADGPDGEIWIIRHPDGSFRRFVLIDKGTRIATADGAEEVSAARKGPDLEVRVRTDRYLFPAAPETSAPSATPHATTS